MTYVNIIYKGAIVKEVGKINKANDEAEEKHRLN